MRDQAPENTRPEAEALFTASPELENSQPRPSRPAHPDRPLVLIVEDNKDVVYYLSSCLEGRYQAAIAHTGREGLDKAIELIPDIIISDIMMPEKDGFELCDTLKSDERTSHIPIILLTAKADTESRITGLKSGADAYLAKPYREEELLVRLEKLIALRLELQKRYASLEAPSTDEGKY